MTIQHANDNSFCNTLGR